MGHNARAGQNPYAICQAHDVLQNVIIFGSVVNVHKEVCCPNDWVAIGVLTIHTCYCRILLVGHFYFGLLVGGQIFCLQGSKKVYISHVLHLIEMRTDCVELLGQKVCSEIIMII